MSTILFLDFIPLDVKLLGHLERLFHRNEGWKVHSDLSDNYAAVSRITGILGVCPYERYRFRLLR